MLVEKRWAEMYMFVKKAKTNVVVHKQGTVRTKLKEMCAKRKKSLYSKSGVKFYKVNDPKTNVP